MRNQLVKLILFTLAAPLLASSPDWSKGVEVRTTRENLFNLSPREFERTVIAGRRHALFYPVAVSELRIPYSPLKTFFESDPEHPVRKLLFELTRVVSPFKSMNEVYTWLGLHDFPHQVQPETPNPLPPLNSEERALPMGATLVSTENGTGLTFGCATCHTGDLFGVKVIGLTNRFPRANEFFRRGAQLAPYINSFVFRDVLEATEGERLMLVKAKEHLRYVGAKPPVVLGLDTSLAQVALSLARREPDELATRTEHSYRRPRPNRLETLVADSKPAVWWNLKYKNRWLSDGSIVSGNPVHTNLLWNEIGRGTDLAALEKWLLENQKTIDELTAAVFASKAPRFEKFFGADAIDLERARRGEAHFVTSCQRCHGVYEKAWNSPSAKNLSKEALLQTTRVTYHRKTPVRDVRTDPGRYLGMREFADDLNRLKISRAIGAVVEPQTGYVPPPLEGIWARWPYFHNNSVPNLCALLTPGSKRPVTYWAGSAENRRTDFDSECVGYPLGEKTPQAWKTNREHFYDTRRPGLSNVGHDEGIFLKDGVQIYGREEKRELIEFLKTL
jgi:mono/diheme cytochrome c family protein